MHGHLGARQPRTPCLTQGPARELFADCPLLVHPAGSATAKAKFTAGDLRKQVCMGEGHRDGMCALCRALMHGSACDAMGQAPCARCALCKVGGRGAQAGPHQQAALLMGMNLEAWGLGRIAWSFWGGLVGVASLVWFDEVQLSALFTTI